MVEMRVVVVDGLAVVVSSSEIVGLIDGTVDSFAVALVG